MQETDAYLDYFLFFVRIFSSSAPAATSFIPINLMALLLHVATTKISPILSFISIYR